MKILNPATEELLQEIAEDSAASIEKKYKSLLQGQKKWREIPFKERIAAFARFLTLLDQKKEKLARTLTLEMGKPIRESLNELAGARKRIRFFIDSSEEVLKPRVTHEESEMTEQLVFEPLGVVANISAWNYPYLVGVNVFVPALIGGNAVLYKPSEFTTLTGMEVAQLLWEAGIPQEVFQPVIGDGSVGRLLLDLPLNGYFFTGSYRTGQAIANQVGSRLIPFGLELGGKDPLYVADDIKDISSVAAAAVEGSFYNNGQSCCAVERIYVHKRVFDPFLDSFLTEVKRLKVGDPLDPQTTQGPLARPPHITFLETQVKDALHHGAKLLTGGKRSGSRGSFFEPTVFTDVDHTMGLMKEETFGPLIGIQKVENDEEAIRLMNDTEYGLTASIYSADETRARRILGQIDVGTGYWNCCDRVSPYLPWSGRKHSGLGSTLSYLGIQAFVRPKAYHLRKPNNLP